MIIGSMNILRIASVFLVLGLTQSYSKGQDVEQWRKIHSEDDLKWAHSTHLAVQQVRQIRIAAGVKDDLEDGRIESLDLRGLASRKQVLLVTAAGNGHCLTITVLVKKDSTFENLWQVDEIPRLSGFCHNGVYSRDFSVYAKSGHIVVNVPQDHSGNDLFGRIRKLIYTWNGHTYELSQELK